MIGDIEDATRERSPKMRIVKHEGYLVVFHFELLRAM